MLKKKVISMFLVLVSITAMNSSIANAEWKQDNAGWWYKEGTSYAKGWRMINGNWYYFNNNGYMAKNMWVDNYYLNNEGTIAEYVGFDKMRLSGETKSSLKEFYNKPAHVVDSINHLSIAGNDYMQMYKSNICGKMKKSKTLHDDYIFNLNNSFTRFTAVIGIDDYYKKYNNATDESKENACAEVLIIGDGNILEKKLITYGEDPVNIDVNLQGYNKLIIRVSMIEGNAVYSSYYDILDGKFYLRR